MKHARLLLIPVTVAWFLGGLWWLARPGSCACSQPTQATAPAPKQAAVIHLGPASALPTVTAVPVAPGTLIVPFTKNTGEFTPTSEQLDWCQRAIAGLHTDPRANVLVTGHTDADGDPAWNRRLSAYRARLVMEGLIAAGIPSDRIRFEGRGAAEPIADNLTSKGKALNRRVEASITQLP